MVGGVADGRIAWVDTARGIAILLVVVYHAALSAQGVSAGVDAWVTVNSTLALFRMPLFFFVSGFLASAALDRSWRVLVRDKFVPWLWVYVVWSFISFSVFSVVSWRRPGPAADPSTSLWSLFGWPDGGLWYLYALAVFLLIVRVTRAWPTLLVVGIATTSAGIFGTLLDVTGNFVFDNMGRYLLFFVLGARAPELVANAPRWAAPKGLAVAAAVYATAAGGLATAAWVTGAAISAVGDLPFVRSALSVLAVGAGVILSAVLARTRLCGLLTRTGQQTLPIYVAHQIVLGCLAAGLLAVIGRPPGWTGGWLPLALSLTAVVAALALRRVLGVLPGLYGPPRWLHRLVDPALQR